MGLLAAFIVASLIGAGMIAWVIFWASNRSSAAAITQYFKASEHILDTGLPPPDWLVAPAWKRLLGKAEEKASQARLLARLDELIRFFEHCSFYEDEFAREQHLSQLEDLRQSWKSGKIG